MKGLALVLVLSCCGGLAAATFTVTNLNDSGAGSLRQAMLDAQGAAGSDTIVFQGGLTGTITLASMLPNVTTPITIFNGDPLALTISGNNAVPVFGCSDGASLTVSGLTIADGSFATTGGAIYAAAAATSCQISFNRCNIRDSSAANGAGVYLLATTGGTVSATFDSCSFVGNSAGMRGGGIAVVGSAAGANLLNCTFSGNSAVSSGGAISAESSGTVSLTNCTLTANQAATGGALSRNNGTLSLRACLVAQNLGPAGSPDGSGTMTSFDGNLIGDATGITITAGSADQFGSAATPIDAMLQALADYGGGVLSHRPDNASPAIDAADVAGALTYDQRSYNRDDGLADCGAIELQPPQLDVSQGGSISSGSNLYLSGSLRPGAPRVESFTVNNFGQAGERNLDLGPTPQVIVTGFGNCSAVVTTQPAQLIAGGASAPFTLTVTPTAEGIYWCRFAIFSNDPITYSYELTLIGAADTAPGTGGGGEESKCSAGEEAAPPATALLLLAVIAARWTRRRRAANDGKAAFSTGPEKALREE